MGKHGPCMIVHTIFTGIQTLKRSFVSLREESFLATLIIAQNTLSKGHTSYQFVWNSEKCIPLLTIRRS